MPVLRLCLLCFLLFLSVNPGYAQVFGTAADYTFTTIDFPGASSTEVSGINNAGTMVGSFTDASGVAHGFIYDGVTFRPLDVPGASSTGVSGINNAGTIVGEYVDSNNRTHGFLYTNATFATIDAPGDFRTIVKGINDTGLIVGYVIQGIFGTSGGSGFVYDGTTFNIFDAPGLIDNTIPFGINNRGFIVGLVFVYDGTTFHSFNVPGGLFTEAHDISNTGVIVGRFNQCDATFPGCRIRGFIFDDMTFTALDVPGSLRP